LEHSVDTGETPADKLAPEMTAAYDYTLKLRGLVPGPHKIYLANPKLLRTSVPTRRTAG
jgi:4-carboxymuconolactone decarboxylase